MKRRYKTGDWVRVPLGGEVDGLAIVARACRSRLFGYFFALPASHTPTHGELRALRPHDAVAALLFGGSAIEQARWQIIATSLGFDPRKWPFPTFASRGAFGEAWTEIRYDPQTLQILERRGIAREIARTLPDARFAGAQEVEATLRRCIAGEPAPRAQSICELRSPVDPERLDAMREGGRIQFSTPLSAPDYRRLAWFIDAHPQVALRVHGFRHGFDAALLARFTGLRDLTLDVHAVQHADALRELRALRTLRIGPMRIDLRFFDRLAGLRALELRGTRASLEPLLELSGLQSLTIENTATLDFRSLACARRLQALVLAHGQYDLRNLDALANLRRLELRALDAAHLPPLHALPKLEHLAIEGLARVTDLRPIAQAGSLRELRIAAMPQLNVQDFEPVGACAGLRLFEVDVGSRRKEREIYRLLEPTRRQGRSGRRVPGT